MVKDAEAHAEEDRQRREEAEVRNNADTLVYQTEKLLKEQGDKVSGDEKDEDRGRAQGAEGRARPAPTSRPIKRAHENADDREPGASPSGSTSTAAGRRTRPTPAAAPGAGATAADDDEVADAEIVDDERGEGR